MDIGEVLGEWFNKNDGTFKFREICEKIKAYRKEIGHKDSKREINYGELTNAIKKTREWLEINRKTTLWNIHMVGYRRANPKEVAIYSMRAVKRCIHLAERTHRLADCVDRMYIPEAFNIVFPDIQSKTRLLASKGRRFIQIWNKVRKEEPKLLGCEVKTKIKGE